MRARYCVELNPDKQVYIVHKQTCMDYPLAELIPHNLVVDLGAYKDCAAALREARRCFDSRWYPGECRCLFPEGEMVPEPAYPMHYRRSEPTHHAVSS